MNCQILFEKYIYIYIKNISLSSGELAQSGEETAV